MWMFNLFCLSLALVAVVGWIMNVVALAGMSFDPITTTLVLRCVGIVMVPLGAVMGLFF